MAFPRINALGFWMVPSGGLLTLSGFVFGGAANTGSGSGSNGGFDPGSDVDQQSHTHGESQTEE